MFLWALSCINIIKIILQSYIINENSKSLKNLSKNGREIKVQISWNWFVKLFSKSIGFSTKNFTNFAWIFAKYELFSQEKNRKNEGKFSVCFSIFRWLAKMSQNINDFRTKKIVKVNGHFCFRSHFCWLAYYNTREVVYLSICKYSNTHK